MINLITDLISFTQPTNLDKESLSVIESIAKIKKVVNECITQFNNLEKKTDEDYNNFLKQIKDYKNYIETLCKQYKNETLEIIQEFKELIEALKNIEITVEWIKQQSEFVQDLAKQNQDAIDKGTIATKDDINKINTSLEHIASEIKSKEINILYPPLGLLPLIINDESKAEENTKRLNNIINFYSNNLVTLYFPKGNYYLVPTIRIKTNIRIKGDSTRNGTIFKDISLQSNTNPLFLYSASDTDLSDPMANRIWGCEISDIFISGNEQEHDALQFIKTGWEGKIRNLWVEGFKGRALYLQDVYDTTWENVTIFNCGGLIDDVAKYSIELNGNGNTTNAQHFNNLHIEHCRYMVNIEKARHCYFVNSKFEQDYANNDGINPVHRFGENAREIGFCSCMLVGNHVNEYTNGVPYYIEGTTPTSSGGITTYTSCDFATGDVYGLKMLNTNGRVFKLDNCSVAHLSGIKDSIKLKDKSTITNSTFICRTLSDGTCQSISVGNAIFKDNDLQSSGNKPSTSSSVLTTIDNNFTIENNYYSTQFDYKLDNTAKYLGIVSRRKDVIPIFSQEVIKNGKLDIGQNFYRLIKLNPNANVELTHVTNYCSIGEEFIIYNTNANNKITIKNVSGDFVSNTGQIRTKTQQDLILNGDEFAILKWTGTVWFVIN